jgi:hypothetical protein
MKLGGLKSDGCSEVLRRVKVGSRARVSESADFGREGLPGIGLLSI